RDDSENDLVENPGVQTANVLAQDLDGGTYASCGLGRVTQRAIDRQAVIELPVQQTQGRDPLLPVDEETLLLISVAVNQHRAHVVGRLGIGLLLIGAQVVGQLPHLVILPDKAALVGVHRQREGRLIEETGKAQNFNMHWNGLVLCSHTSLVLPVSSTCIMACLLAVGKSCGIMFIRARPAVVTSISCPSNVMCLPASAAKMSSFSARLFEKSNSDFWKMPIRLLRRSTIA